MKGTWNRVLIVVLTLGLAAAAWGQSSEGPVVKPGAVVGKAGSPPPASATKAKSAGKGAASVSTANTPADDDSFWVEKLDIDGDGNVEDTNLVWDDEDKVLYAYSEATFQCKKGGTGAGGVLVAVNAAGNARNRPAGSGFWVAAVDKGECGSESAGLWGCRFDASGNETACGVAVVDAKNDDIVIAAAKKM
jgi:hypothetical protein